MTEETVTEAHTTTETTEATTDSTFTKEDVDKIVRDRLAQQAKNKFGDYDALKAKASESTTLEDRIAEMEKRTAEAEARALRSDIAAKHGISAEDRDLFLTGVDADTLTAQAERLAAHVSAQKKQGNVAPKEGAAKTTGDQGGDAREFVGELFGKSD